jgi:hypothetical protein
VGSWEIWKYGDNAKTVSLEAAYFSRNLSPLRSLCIRSLVRPLVPKVSAALWERMLEAKLRFLGERVSMKAAAEVVVRRKGRRSLSGTSVHKTLR